MNTVLSTNKLNKLSLIQRYFPFLLWLIGAAFLFYYAPLRLVARDEGYYIYAAELVAAGKLPYVDFFYPQMPLMPYLYGMAFKIFGSDWLVARYLSAFLTTLTLALLLLYARRFGLLASIVSTLLFCSSNFVLPWFLVVQTYALATLFSFAAYLTLERAIQNKNITGQIAVLSGALIGAAIMVRLPFAVLAPAVMLHLVFSRTKRLVLILSCFVLGIFITVLPALILLVSYWPEFLYNNLGYHLSRASRSWAAGIADKTKIMLVLFGITDSVKFVARQFPLLIWGWFFVFIAQLFQFRISLNSVFVLALFVVHILPNPAYVHYFAVLIPWLIVALIQVSGVKIFGVSRLKFRVVRFSIIIIFCAVYCSGSLIDFDHYSRTGEGVIGIMNRNNAKRWTIEQITSVQKKIDQIAAPGELIYSSWPGFLVGSHALALPGTENHFGSFAAAKLDPQKSQQFKVLGFDALHAQIKSRAIRVVVMIKNTAYGVPEALEEAGYKQAAVVGPARIFVIAGS